MRAAALLAFLLAQPSDSLPSFPLARLLAGRGRGRPSREWAALRTACGASTTCAPLPAGGETWCVLGCMSPRCAAAVYGADGLEPGELEGAQRAARFADCIKAAEAPLRAAKKWPPALREDGVALEDADEDEYAAAEAPTAAGAAGAAATGAAAVEASGDGRAGSGSESARTGSADDL